MRWGVLTVAVAVQSGSWLRAEDLPAPTPELQRWNWHVQNTAIVQGDPGFSAKYSGTNSLQNDGEVRETVSFDLYTGVRLWRGAEAHVDAMVWQGFGLSQTRGVADFPNGEAFRLGTQLPNINLARAFIRQTIPLGSDDEPVIDDALHLAGPQSVSRITLTAGRISAKDIFDNNLYANDARTQFMNWGLMANPAWDYPADALGYIDGAAVELNQPQWALRYGIFQVPRVSNGVSRDPHWTKAWGMVTELEWRWKFSEHPGAIRPLAYLNRAHMGSYAAALENPVRPADIEATRDYRYKFGFGLNLEQEVAHEIGIFSRLGWSDGENEAWAFSDVDRTASLGLSIKGGRWQRPNDTLALAGVLSGISPVHQEFLAAGGRGILVGDGSLSYGEEKALETYYSCNLWKTIFATVDYQFVSNPAFNRDRGPVSVFAARLRWEY